MSLQIETTDTRKCKVDMTVPSYEDVEYLCNNIRTADRIEAHAATGAGIVDVVRDAFRVSQYAVSLRFNDELVGIFGLRKLTEQFGVPWALGTPVAKKFPHHFISCSAGILRGMLKEYPVLVNMMDARNTDGLRWARVMGFEIVPAIKHGPFELPFHPIVLRRPANV